MVDHMLIILYILKEVKYYNHKIKQIIHYFHHLIMIMIKKKKKLIQKKKQSEPWMTWRYPSPRHVSTSPIYQLLAHAILSIHNDDDSISVSTAYMRTNPNDSYVSSKRQSFSFLRKTLETELDREQVVSVTVVNVSSGESLLDVYTGDIQIYFRRRLVFLTKYVLDSYTKIFKQIYNEPGYNSGNETKLPGYSSGLHPASEYILENYCSLPLWYGQISTSHSFCWWNASQQKLRLSVDNGEHWSEPFPTKKGTYHSNNKDKDKDKDKKITSSAGRFKNIIKDVNI
eukprot:450258_1